MNTIEPVAKTLLKPTLLAVCRVDALPSHELRCNERDDIGGPSNFCFTSGTRSSFEYLNTHSCEWGQMAKVEGAAARALVAASRAFEAEDTARSVRAVLVTAAAIAALVVTIAWLPVGFARVPAATLLGLVLARTYVLYHDHKHGALLRGSQLARLAFNIVGTLLLVPSAAWTHSHNYHHAHNSQIVGSHIGSFPLMTVAMWKISTPWQRFRYAAARSSLLIAAGYMTVFFGGFCVVRFLRDRRHWDSLVAVVVHLSFIAILWAIGGFSAVWSFLLLPMTVAGALGAYLFYAQHNFVGMKLQSRESWDYVQAALVSSSFMRMGPLMNWMTANIGYHHIHHLNARIPFYRLPEAMAAIPELANPTVTSLHPVDVWRTLRLKLWDSDRDRMIHFSEWSKSSP
jgi:acyl-lipid omega-6 desaturase (Delta-12 desaturase)